MFEVVGGENFPEIAVFSEKANLRLAKAGGLSPMRRESRSSPSLHEPSMESRGIAPLLEGDRSTRRRVALCEKRVDFAPS